jgi:hypothetical protein
LVRVSPRGEQLFVDDGWEHLAATVTPPGVVVVDEPGDGPAGLVFGLEGVARQQLGLEGRVPALGSGVVNAEPTRPIDWVTLRASQALVNRSPTYSPPLSE